MRRLRWIATALLALCLLCGFAVCAQGVVSTSVVMRVSRLTQDAVVNEGEDLSMEVNVEGAQATAYQWYFNDAPIDGATQRVYNIIDARESDAGIYRLDAFDAQGGLVLRMDIAARVITEEIPQAGDDSMPLWVAVAAVGIGALLLAVKLRRGVA